jgi:lactoylglutathione lyase
MKLAHIGIWTRDHNSAAALWRRYFQATVGEEYHSTRRVGFVSRFITIPGGAQIELMTSPWLENRTMDEQIGWDHVAISLGSRIAVDELAARCEADGLLLAKPRTTGDGFYEAVIASPDGSVVEITA